MKKQITAFACGAACVAAMFLFSAQVLSQDKTDSPPEGANRMAEMMAKWNEINALGPEHEKFKKMVGTWSFVSKMWMVPGAPPMESVGVSEFKLILNDRFIEQTYKCDFMGAAYVGKGIEGFDRVKNKYVSLWMDNTSNGIFMLEGTVDQSGKVCTYYGKMDDPMTGQKDKVYKSVGREIDDDNVVFEMFETQPDGSEFKTMSITYKRKK